MKVVVTASNGNSTVFEVQNTTQAEQVRAIAITQGCKAEIQNQGT